MLFFLNSHIIVEIDIVIVTLLMKFIQTRLIFLGIYLASIILILLFTRQKMSFISKVYSGSLIIFFILDNGFDIYVLKHPKNNNENLSISLERIIV